MDPSLPPSPGARPSTWRAHVDDLADRLGTTPAAILTGGAGALVVLVVVAVVVLGRSQGAPEPELTIPYAAGSGTEGPAIATTSTSAGVAEVLVHAAGAVARPGVYSLPPDSRVGDLLNAAGGPVGDADVDRLNLAAPLVDGTRVYVPTSGEIVAPSVLGPDVAGADDGGASGPIDLNTASAATLEELPGVGPATAAAIVSHREQNGPFGSVDDLLDVRGIGDAKLAALRDLVTV